MTEGAFSHVQCTDHLSMFVLRTVIYLKQKQNKKNTRVHALPWVIETVTRYA